MRRNSKTRYEKENDPSQCAHQFCVVERVKLRGRQTYIHSIEHNSDRERATMKNIFNNTFCNLYPILIIRAASLIFTKAERSAFYCANDYVKKKQQQQQYNYYIVNNMGAYGCNTSSESTFECV